MIARDSEEYVNEAQKLIFTYRGKLIKLKQK